MGHGPGQEGFLLLVSLAVSAGLATLHGFSLGLRPGAKVLLEVVNAAFSFGVVTVPFGAFQAAPGREDRVA